jgi:hypothetical protein
MGKRVRTIGAAWLGLGLLMWGLAVGDLGLPGPNYDEVVQAIPSLEFLAGWTRGPGLPGSEVLRLRGLPFPWMTQPYMGALKSQMLIPSFALAGGDLSVLRITTLAWSALGLLFCVAFAQRAFGSGAAVVSGLLLVSDPSFLFMSRHDWGSFSLGFLLRCASLLLALAWWKSGKLRHALMAGATLGLGTYNKIDFVLFLAAAVLALLATHRHELARLLRERRAQTVGAIATTAFFALPVLASLPEFGGEAERLAEQVSFSEQMRSLGSVLDGSYFVRLMRVGGRFEDMFDLLEVARGGLGLALLVSAAGLAVGAVRRTAPSGSALLLLCGFILAGLLLLLPGAVRAHHLMNLYPFPHWIVAVGLIALWRERRRPGTSPLGLVGRRAVAGALLLAVVATNLRVVGDTHAELERSGGRGYWSDAVVGFVEEVADSPGARVVCLDWGLHNPIAFLDDAVRSLDAIWPLRRALARGEAWSFVGDAGTVYLIHSEPFDLFELGAHFQRALETLPAERITIRPHLDREGGVAFLAVRLNGPHRILYDGRRFSIALERAATRSRATRPGASAH